MKLQRNRLQVAHRIEFQKPAVSLMTRSGQLIESVTDALGSKYPQSLSDVTIIPAQRVQDWSLRFTLFNGLVGIRMGVDSVESTYKNLGTDTDIDLAVAVESTVYALLKSHSPDLVYTSEKLSGHIDFDVVGGVMERNSYFSRVDYPGRSDKHQFASFRVVYPSPKADLSAVCEIAPMYNMQDKLFVAFDIDLTKLQLQQFDQKAQLAMELLGETLSSVGLEP
ncbi:MAG: hypothetical protein JSS56_02915 [Proteobacteria bacterium]|nr:hypothetical protein [Pseudomonadota bacterium]